VEEVTPWLQEKYRVSHSYLLTEPKSSLTLIKRIYGLPLAPIRNIQFWHYNDTLIVPLRTRNKHIVGFFILDDPKDKRRPNLELVQIIEKIARLVAVTIENKIIYTQLKSKYQQMETSTVGGGNIKQRKSSGNKIKQIFKRINFNV